MTEAAQRAWDLMKSLDYCFLVAETEDGMRARPMSTIVRQEEDMIYILSNAGAEQIADIAALPNVLLNYSNGSSKFVSASAQAMLSTDRALIARLWNPGAQAFWPEGPEKADVTVICATPREAEFWDGPGSVVSVAKMAAALVTGSTPDMGDNEKVAL